MVLKKDSEKELKRIAKALERMAATFEMYYHKKHASPATHTAKPWSKEDEEKLKAFYGKGV